MRPPHGSPEDMFKHLERDGDGKISKREFFASPRMERLPLEQREAIFGRLDRDGDGFLEPEEIRAMRHDNERRMKEGFRKLDADKSGGLSFEEFSKGELFGKLPEEKRRQIFGRMDTDGSGEINGKDKPKGPPIRPEKPERRPDRNPVD
jgi:Ca2+-binding EF-hand superfamily protein